MIEDRDYIATDTTSGRKRTYTVSRHVIKEGRLDWALDCFKRWAVVDLDCRRENVKLERVWTTNELQDRILRSP